MKRREFFAASGLLAGGATLLSRVPDLGAGLSGKPDERAEPRISFDTTDAQYQSVYSLALKALEDNINSVSGYQGPVLLEGSNYQGIWLECTPHEGLVYSALRPDVARNNQLAFFALQREDGQLPCWVRTSGAGFGQIQMVVPIAATAWELSQEIGDTELLERAYTGCSRWDEWLRRYRETRETGLCEGFCAWDTGHDHSPRWSGIPDRCPDGDARKCPPLPSLPRLCPDLSATVYGGRVALASMAGALGKNFEADHWLAEADAIRMAIIGKLYSPEGASFYDLDAQGRFVRIRGDVISRVLGEHVVDQRLFDTIYLRQIHNPSAFWAPYPLPSIALDDPAFVRPIQPNSWGGASQVLTALRAPRWMEHYGKPADLAHLMQQWVGAILRQHAFLQQMDPVNGTFTPDAGDYSPAALVFLDFTWRLAGVRRVANSLEWNIRPPGPNVRANYRLRLSPMQTATIKYASGRAELFLNEKPLYSTSSTLRVVTNLDGEIQRTVGIDAEKGDGVLQVTKTGGCHGFRCLGPGA